MLTHLSVQNFSLIDHIEIDFKDGFTVITGETGAGKSILLGALSLILGERMRHEAQRDASKKCIVEGTFDLSNFNMQMLFEDSNLDYEKTTIFRREISPYGKSRNFINDTPTTLEVMKRIGSELIDIHSQHQSLLINDTAFQLDVLDNLVQNKNRLKEYKEGYNAYKKGLGLLLEKREYANEAKKKKDYLQFQLDELSALGLKEGEVEELETEQRFFANSEEILNNFKAIQHLLSGEEPTILSQVSTLKQYIDTLRNHLDEIGEVQERFNSLTIELNDLANEMESYAENYQYDPERHQLIEERLTEIHRLQQKHALANTDQLIEYHRTMEEELNAISFIDDEIKGLEEGIEKQYEELLSAAKIISNNRKKVVTSFAKEVELLLKALGIPHARFEVSHQLKETIALNGIDEFEFLFSANKGLAPQKIAATASGGEISRLMLAVKYILSEHKQMPSIIFDEIDTGVSGEIADKMGGILGSLGKHCQVISITHLPQIAAKGKTHIMVFKDEEEGLSKTRLKQLDNEERIREMAKMLSGEKMSEAAINNAKELLSM